MEGIPVFYRGGNVVARRERPRRSSGAQSEDPYTLVVVLDKESKAAGDLYIDDGESFSFQRGHYAHRDFVFDGTKLKNVVRMSSACSTSYCPGGSMGHLVISCLRDFQLPQRLQLGLDLSFFVLFRWHDSDG